MSSTPYAALPLRNRDGDVVGSTLVDQADVDRLGLSSCSLSLQRGSGRNARFKYAQLWYAPEPGAARRVVKLHRLLLCRPGDPRIVDHINGDRLDNRRANLRLVSYAENAQNQVPAAGTSVHRGVCWHKQTGRWNAQGQVSGVRHYIGLFDDELEAAAAARAWRAQHLPFANEARH